MSLWFFSSGDGDSNARIDERLLAYVPGEKPLFTFVPSSADDAEYYYDEFIDRFGRYGYKNFNMLTIDEPFTASDLKRAMESDLIYQSGGNTFYFLQALRQSGFEHALRAYYANGGVIAGHSAGAILMTPNIETASYPKEDRDENDVNIKDWRALRFVDFEVFPHYVSKLVYNNELKQVSRRRGRPIYAVPDGSAVSVEPGQVCFHGPVWAFVKGVRFKVSW